MTELIEKIKALQQQVRQLKNKLGMAAKEAEIKRGEEQINQPDFWRDQKKAAELSKRLAGLQAQVADWNELEKEIDELDGLAADDQSADVLADELQNKFWQLQERFQLWETQLLFKGKHDGDNAIVTIYAGAGGDDAQDWAQMLERMYLRLAEKSNWPVSYFSRSVGGEAGIKSATFLVTGLNVFGYLKTEAGVHRLVRLSPFDADHARHTSFAMVEVLPELKETELKINPEDLQIDTFRSSGHGGQSVNTTDSAVRVTHLPTGLQATCQNERSQQQNKSQALIYLYSKLQQYYETEQEDKRRALKGEFTEAAWGNQIRSYVLHPYKMVKDHRTNWQTADPQSVLDGDLLPAIYARLQQQIS